MQESCDFEIVRFHNSLHTALFLVWPIRRRNDRVQRWNILQLRSITLERADVRVDVLRLLVAQTVLGKVRHVRRRRCWRHIRTSTKESDEVFLRAQRTRVYGR